MSKKKPGVSGRTTIGKVLHYLRKYTAWMALSLLCAAGSVVLTLLAPILVGRAIDCTSGRKTRAVLITDSDHVILTYLQSETVANRLNDDMDELDDEEDEDD